MKLYSDTFSWISNCLDFIVVVYLLVFIKL